jgi:cytochrome c553
LFLHLLGARFNFFRIVDCPFRQRNGANPRMSKEIARMKKLLMVVMVLVVCASGAAPAFAIKQLSDQFKALYVGDSATPEFKAAIEAAKCNICHVEGENKKKVRNAYGNAVHEALEKDKFPLADLKKEPAKFAERLNGIYKKLEEEKSDDAEKRTFGARMKANLSPGGDKDGK